jgi:hypothetical protein
MYRVVPKTTIEIVRILHDRWTFSVIFHLPQTRMPNRTRCRLAAGYPGAILDGLACSGVEWRPLAIQTRSPKFRIVFLEGATHD